MRLGRDLFSGLLLSPSATATPPPHRNASPHHSSRGAFNNSLPPCYHRFCSWILGWFWIFQNVRSKLLEETPISLHIVFPSQKQYLSQSFQGHLNIIFITLKPIFKRYWLKVLNGHGKTVKYNTGGERKIQEQLLHVIDNLILFTIWNKTNKLDHLDGKQKIKPTKIKYSWQAAESHHCTPGGNQHCTTRRHASVRWTLLSFLSSLPARVQAPLTRSLSSRSILVFLFLWFWAVTKRSLFSVR